MGAQAINFNNYFTLKEPTPGVISQVAATLIEASETITAVDSAYKQVFLMHGGRKELDEIIPLISQNINIPPAFPRELVLFSHMMQYIDSYSIFGFKTIEYLHCTDIVYKDPFTVIVSRM